MANSQLYTVGQNTKITLTTPSPIIAVGGDNPTPYYLFFPSLPFGMQWVFPFIYGFMYPFPAPRFDAVLVDTTTQPAGAQIPPTSSALANLTAYQASASEPPPGFSPGTPSIEATIQRWNINAFPAGGAQATATKAAAPGVIHVCDSALIRFLNKAAAASAFVSADIADGPSGSTAYFLLTGLIIPATTGAADSLGMLGPGLNYRGTPGNAMTCEFAAGGGGANTQELVTMSGFDQ